MNAKATLYLDIDGVVNYMGSRNQHAKRSGLGYLRRSVAIVEGIFFPFNWSGQLLCELDEIDGLEIVLLSTWNSYPITLFETLNWTPDRILSEVECQDTDRAKLEELIEDQKVNPRPFIWADDTATALDVELPDDCDALIIQPDEKIGLTKDDLDAIRSFVCEL